MKLCIISPTAGLEKYATQSEGVHLALIHLVESDPVYRDFYRKRSEMGDTIILDNGAFEFGEPAEADRMMEAGAKIKAHILVAPDYPKENWKKTLEAAQAFSDKLQNTPFTGMGVPQSEIGDFEGWCGGFGDMLDILNLSHVGVSILATPNAFGPMLGNPSDIELCRLMATTLIKSAMALRAGSDLFKGKKIHYLGLGHRVDLIQYYDIADSLDTSSPVWHGWNDITYKDGWLPEGKLKEPVDFQASFPVRHGTVNIPNYLVEQQIQFNIGVLKDFARKSEHASSSM